MGTSPIESFPPRRVDVDPRTLSPRWEAILRRCGGGPLLLPVIHDLDSRAPECWVFGEEPTPVGCALATVQTPRNRRLPWRRQRILELPAGPQLAEPEAAEAVRRGLAEAARERACERIVLGAASGPFATDHPALCPFRTEAVVGFVLDLSPGADAVFEGMHKTHRKNIRRARRAGLEVVEDASVEALLELRRLQLVSSERARERAEGFGVPEPAFFERLQEQIYGPGFGRLLLAKLEGETVAALAWLEVAGRAQTVRSGSSAEGYERRAMYLLYDECIRRAAAAGAVELDCGGVPAAAAEAGHPQTGLYEFKAGLGGRPRPRYRLDVPTREWLR